MKTLMRVLMFGCLSVVAPRAFAQENSGIIQSPPAKIEGKFAIVHFDRDDRTAIGLAHQKVGGENGCGIWVTAGYTYVGKQLAKPERVYISFVRDSTDEPKLLKSEKERLLILTVDGENVTLGPMPSVKEVVIGYSLVSQGLLLPISYEIFHKIANARNVAVKLGPLKFNLTDQNLKDFRELLRRMTT
jgi:hypothetical protein